MLEKIKKMMMITVTDYDDTIQEYIDMALDDLGIAGVTGYAATDRLILGAVGCYVQMHFGIAPNYDQLKAAYDEQKMQLQTASGYNGRGSGAAC